MSYLDRLAIYAAVSLAAPGPSSRISLTPEEQKKLETIIGASDKGCGVWAPIPPRRTPYNEQPDMIKQLEARGFIERVPPSGRKYGKAK